VLGTPAAHAADPTIYVRYTMSCTFTISGDSGAPISVIPPGRYQILVTSPVPFAQPDLSDVTDPNYSCGGALSFRLTGPGVSFFTSLEGGGDPSDEFDATFVAGTYVAQEDRRPTVTRTIITVASGAASTGADTAGGASSGGSSGGGAGNSNALIPTTGKPSRTRTPAPAVNLEASRGTLQASVSAAGKSALTFKGKGVSFLKAGRYTVKVADGAGTRGFTLQKVGQHAISLSGLRFVGQKTVTVTLARGQWVFYSMPATKTYFIVTA
jgi:hypothetical protein